MKLQEGIQKYVEDKQAQGMRFSGGNQKLISFCCHVGDIPLDKIRHKQVLTFLDGPQTSVLTWAAKYNLLLNFFRFWVARDLMHSLPMPPPRRPPKRNFTPYIYSQTEVRRLLKSTRTSQANDHCRIDAQTLRICLLFLYGTGVWISEAIRITRGDLDLKRGTVVIRNNRLEPSRTIPFGPDLCKALKSYCNSHHRGNSKGQQLFLHMDEKPLTEDYVHTTFRRLRRCAGITRHDRVDRPPRLHDLRYTFAVHRLTAWHRRGADLNRMIPALSVYMGYMNLSASAKFLSLTPERFRAQLNKLSPHQGKRRWRNDAALMKFLDGI